MMSLPWLPVSSEQQAIWKKIESNLKVDRLRATVTFTVTVTATVTITATVTVTD